jgi:hypothetical protein
MFVVGSKLHNFFSFAMTCLLTFRPCTEKDPVFPYMDHDLAGLLENERVKLQPSQIKFYMKQLFGGN